MENNDDTAKSDYKRSDKCRGVALLPTASDYKP